jgi:CBS domain-containing protein
MRSYPNFLRLMAQNALQVRPALGRWRDFVTEDAPNAPKTINLKQYGVRPFIEAARIMAFARGLPQTNTAERLRAASAAGGLPSREAEAIIASLFFVQGLRLRHQARLEKLDEDTANRIDPETLHELDRRMLKESFRLARDLQSRLRLDYQL